MRKYWLHMALILQLDSEMEQTLTEQARLQGFSVERYIQQILARQLALQTTGQKLSEEEFESVLDAMTVYSDKIPVLPLEAFQRDEIYRDHD
jgi:hypothetical protein